MFLAWPGGTARAGESIPWSNQKPDFNALGIYVKGANEEMESDFIVFDPAQIAGIKLTRWKNYDGGMTMAFQAEAVSEVVFAIGCAAGENGGEVAVPRFLKDERTRIFQALRAIEWAMPFDFEKLQKLLDETGKMLKAHPDDALQARFDRLKDAIRQAAAGNQTEAYIQLEKQLHELNRELVDASLDKMLE